MRVKLILNPIAGRGRGARAKDALLAALRRSGTEFDAAITGQRGAGRLLAKQALAEGYDTIIAAGGDGTVNEVVNGIAGGQACLGVLPLGTGNDFAAMMGMPKDPVAGLERILRGRRLPVDLCRVNERFYVSSVGAGFDGEVCYTANHKFKHLRGMAVYLTSVFATILTYKPRCVKLTIDGKTYEREILLVAVANSRSYGGGMLVTPEAAVDDGFFDICLAEKMGTVRVSLNLPRFVKGRHLTMPEVTMLRGREVLLESTTPLYYQVDGEVMEDTRLAFRLIPHGLSVAGAEFTPTPVAAQAAGAGENR
ncbi:MAG: diacylglycerol/lipid kinase family protein [Bacteroidota bacterium]